MTLSSHPTPPHPTPPHPRLSDAAVWICGTVTSPQAKTCPKRLRVKSVTLKVDEKTLNMNSGPADPTKH